MRIFGTWKRTVAYLWIILIFSSVGTYLYFRGAYDGVIKYKRSSHMQLALKSAYHFGYLDAKEGRKEDWGEDVAMQLYCTDCSTIVICWSGNWYKCK